MNIDIWWLKCFAKHIFEDLNYIILLTIELHLPDLFTDKFFRFATPSFMHVALVYAICLYHQNIQRKDVFVTKEHACIEYEGDKYVSWVWKK